MSSPEPQPRTAGEREDRGVGPVAEDSPRRQRLLTWRARMLASAREPIGVRLSVLADLGFAADDLALVAQSQEPPLPLNDLWEIVGFLIDDGTYDEAGIVAWMSDRQRRLGGARPLELLARGGQLTRVRTAAEGHLRTAGLMPSERSLDHLGSGKRRRCWRRWLGA
ncbi:hypothetical protein Q5424_08335 [Conexibacter sp. JD483]|uniref:hypothetical protein n=1 Tax=unclassified Conexibacter TaxID=2627773 RepID=UPI00271964EB|nr:MULTISPECIES: hypothetical protein [unclassified Conexibacter]MDO8183954.1 hypothetical protein [Conexibacter sp. CPCC 205706]MDO8196946.1 hypothetical protein [Conexibacter sp. CPCC 205762]MDR9369084.1 hypothetical protein [Conexibacter sp. JD483]